MDANKMDSWVSIHIRGGLDKGEISIKDSFLYECVLSQSCPRPRPRHTPRT